MRSLSPVTAGVLVLLVVASLLVAPAAAADVADGNTTANETDGDADALEDANQSVDASNGDDVDTGGYTLDELREGGREIPGADPSSRWLGDGIVYVDYSSPNPLLGGSQEEWQVDNLLTNGDTVEVDELTVHAERGRNADPTEYTLQVVYWEPGETERTITENGETRTETVEVPRNVETENKSLAWSQAFERSDISLSRSDDPRQVTMWIVDENGERVDGAQWTFTHDSIATSQTAPISTMGDLLWWGFWWIVAPSLILLSVVGITVPRLIRAAGNASPDIDWPLWFIGIGVLSFITFAAAYSYLASFIVAIPLVFPITIALIVAALLLETYDDNVRRWAFMSMLTRDTTGPTGEDAKDAVSGTLRRKRITSVDGMVAIPARGLRAFIARIWVGPTVLEGAQKIQGALPLRGSREEQLVFLDDQTPAALKHRPETLKLRLPNLTDPVVAGVGLIALVSTTAFASIVWSNWAIGLGLAFPLLVVGCFRPIPGYAEIHPAPSQARSAYATALYLEGELEKYETIEDLAEALVSEKNRSEEIREQLEDLEDSTIIKQSHNRQEGSLFSDSMKKPDTSTAEGSADD